VDKRSASTNVCAVKADVLRLSTLQVLSRE